MFPSTDPWGRPFSKVYHAERAKVAGTPLAGGYIGIYDGVQCDQEFLKKIFSLQRPLGALRSRSHHIYTYMYFEL